MSPLQSARLREKIEIPDILKQEVTIEKGKTPSVDPALKEYFPLTIGQPEVKFVPGKGPEKPLKLGVVLSGGQAPGGHNVIAGLFDACSELIGFVGGPSGIVENETLVITKDLMDRYRNLGGFDIIGSGRTKIETEEQLASSLKTVQALKLDGLVVIGGDDSNTNAAVLAEYFLAHKCNTCVVGVPKTIDGDLKNEQIEISFGHDTACRVYSELIGNIMRDALSAKKYYHFIRLMGRSASHITLECALQTHPNLALIGEEIAEQNKTLYQITCEITDLVERRAKAGKNFGIILVPEGLIEFIPEIGRLIQELNRHLEDPEKISKEARATFETLPESIQKQLLLDRDPHGNVQVSRIETEQLLIQMVEMELKKRNFSGKFGAVHHFFGYEGRSAMPTPFDCTYCYALGLVAAILIRNGLTGYMSSVRGLTRPVSEWTAGGIPITMMMNLEERHGKQKPVIKKALVDLKGKPLAALGDWSLEDDFCYPGPIQFAGDPSITHQAPITLSLEAC